MKKYIIMPFILLIGKGLLAQDSSLLQLLEDSAMQQNKVVTGTFKATQIVNMPTVEAPPKGGLQFMIMHRFGRINEGGYELFGLDNATIRFALDYGLTDRLAVGVGRSSFDKTFDGSIKWKLVQQKERGWPVSVSLYGLLAHNTLRYSDKPYLNKKFRTSYVTQALLARKFTRNLSLQLEPSWLHFNLVPTSQDKNDVFALGIGGRYKITKRVSINAEYNYLPDDQLVTEASTNSFSFGFDIETGGHVFQLVFSNSQGMAGPSYLSKTTGKWGEGDVYFGFN
ncbi:MAG TPA: DUF5777 family beta-barrel protein, partial [Flavisolibacter sp.]|nr:DUF5777 family beta-barrel protein [Flavisolibacter sp.]